VREYMPESAEMDAVILVTKNLKLLCWPHNDNWLTTMSFNGLKRLGSVVDSEVTDI
jgi:hypothetical protein